MLQVASLPGGAGRRVEGGFMRLWRKDLDNASKDPRFSDGFFLDLFFGGVEGSNTTGAMGSNTMGSGN